MALSQYAGFQACIAAADLELKYSAAHSSLDRSLKSDLTDRLLVASDDPGPVQSQLAHCGSCLIRSGSFGTIDWNAQAGATLWSLLGEKKKRRRSW